MYLRPCLEREILHPQGPGRKVSVVLATMLDRPTGGQVKDKRHFDQFVGSAGGNGNGVPSASSLARPS